MFGGEGWIWVFEAWMWVSGGVGESVWEVKCECLRGLSVGVWRS